MVLDQVRAKRMEPSRIAKPQLVEVAAGISQPIITRPKIVETPSVFKIEKVNPAEEIPGPDISSNDQIGTRKVEAAIISDPETSARIVVSDHPSEKKSSHDETRNSYAVDETTERAILQPEAPEPEPKAPAEPAELNLTNDYCEVDKKPESPQPNYLYGGGIKDDEATTITDIDLTGPMVLGKPQMAESRKVKGKRGHFNIMGWFKKSKKE
jgi:hypothetical protein